ncbi:MULTISPECIES: hypothetical protein [Neobacillus]|uniref:Uncharacterized protein n=1 Tax=Neobacillus rhizophilus TaxID=2833579 RepID=A0A942YTI6_9BACI|nr:MULTISPECIES: hypothetical protein [Neobacillus]MBS4212953.1 hypothetical protein [Neobacillus rhizophilus]MBU8918169.1 hypothetical protein [Bacillus sp. FJAT-29953]
MFKFFSKKQKQKKNEDTINSLLLDKLDRMIELLEKQQQEPNGKSIHIDKVHIDYLENITFQLENIEIDELSGKLLIGTNISGSDDFAASIIQKIDKQELKTEAMSEDAEPSNENITKTSKGFRFRSGG